MNRSPFKKNQVRVNFNYNNSSCKKVQSQETLLQIYNGAALFNHGNQCEQKHKKHKNKHEYEDKETMNVMVSHPTLKKEGFSLYTETLNKKYTKKDGLLEPKINHQMHLEDHLLLITKKGNQIDMLKNEIKYMRKRIMQAENAEKQSRLEFQMYKVSVQLNSSVASFPQIQNQVKQLEQKLIKITANLTESQIQNNQLHSELDSLLNIINSLEKEKASNQQQKNNLKAQCNEVSKQLDVITDKLQRSNELFANYDKDLQILREENINLKCKIMEQGTQQQQSSERLLKKQQQLKGEIQKLNKFNLEQANTFKADLKQRQSEFDKIKAEKQEIFIKGNMEINLLQLELQRVLEQHKLLKEKHDQNIQKIMHDYEMQINRNQLKLKEEHEFNMEQLNQNNRGNSKIEAKSLSKQELNQHINFLKNQTLENEFQQNIRLHQQIQNLKQQIFFYKSASEKTAQDIKQKCSKDTILNKEQYNHQLNIYMKEMEIMVEDMDKINDNGHFYGTILQEQEEYDEIEDSSFQRLCNNLFENSDDAKNNQLSNNLMSLKTSTHERDDQNLKINSVQAKPNNNYNISELNDLDDKVNSYIHRSNKRDHNSSNRIIDKNIPDHQ